MKAFRGWVNTKEGYLVNTDEGAQEGPQLEVVLVVEQVEKAGRLREHLSEGRRHFEATLDQVAHAEHPNKPLQKGHPWGYRWTPPHMHGKAYGTITICWESTYFNTVGYTVVMVMSTTSMSRSTLASGINKYECCAVLQSLNFTSCSAFAMTHLRKHF